MLNHLLAKELLPLAPVSRQFHLLISSILRRRLLDVASLPEHELILECYHPIAKLSTPYLRCRFLGTKTADGSDPRGEDAGSLNRLYSSFRPVVAEENRRRRVWYPVPRVESSHTSADDDEAITQDVFLDADEHFSQLCTAAHVVREGPRQGVFVSHVNISDGVVRVWRDWLARRAGEASAESGDDPSRRRRRGPVDASKTLWVGPSQDVGIVFRVTMGPAERMPLLSEAGEESPVSYTLVYQGKQSQHGTARHGSPAACGAIDDDWLTGCAELLVRTSKLLLGAEKSSFEEVVHSGKAVMIVVR